MEEARRSADEYERARRDPLAIVQGVAHTLDAHPDLPAATRAELVRSMVAAADQPVDVSLDPQQRSSEERELHAVPQLAIA